MDVISPAVIHGLLLAVGDSPHFGPRKYQVIPKTIVFSNQVSFMFSYTQGSIFFGPASGPLNF